MEKLTFMFMLKLLFQNTGGTVVQQNSLFRFSPYKCHNDERELWTLSFQNLGLCIKECHGHGVCKSITYNYNTKSCYGRPFCPSVCTNSSLLVTMDTTSYCRRDCYIDDVNKTKSCYHLSMAKRFTWVNAKLFCERRGSFLVEIATWEEYSYIKSILNKEARYWTGGVTTDGNDWVWDRTRLLFTFTYWVTDEAHNSDERYMMLNRNQKWQSQPGDMMAYPFCEESSFLHHD